MDSSLIYPFSILSKYFLAFYLVKGPTWETYLVVN